MPEPDGPRDRPQRRPPRLPRFSDLLDVSDEMIAFVEKYQKVWEAEGKAMLALGEFLTGRAESMRYQVEMMRMGSDAFRRYTAWSEALLSLRPDTILQSFLGPGEVRRPPRPRPEAGKGDTIT